RARAGIYSRSIVDDVSPERLRLFFDKRDDGYQVKNPIREMCVFALQNLLVDPPFSRMNLVVLCNRLTDLLAVPQEKGIQALHYSLKPSGLLLLDSREKVPSSFANWFKVGDKRHKIYTPISGRSYTRLYPIKNVEAAERVVQSPGVEGTVSAARLEADRILLQKYTPSSVLTNADGDIL